MELFNRIKLLGISTLLLIGINTASAQVLTFVQTSKTIITSPLSLTFFIDLNDDGRDDVVSLSSTGFAPDAPGTGLNFGVNPPVEQYAYALLKVSVQLNKPDGTFGPIQDTVLPLVTDLFRGGTNAQLSFRTLVVQAAKLSSGSGNDGLIFSQVASADDVNLTDYTRSIDLKNAVTLPGNGDGTFRTPVITNALLLPVSRLI